MVVHLSQNKHHVTYIISFTIVKMYTLHHIKFFCRFLNLHSIVLNILHPNRCFRAILLAFFTFQSSYYIMFCVSLIYHYFKTLLFKLPPSLTNNTVCITRTRKNITQTICHACQFCKRYNNLMCQFLNFVKHPSYWYHASHLINLCLSCIHVCFLQ